MHATLFRTVCSSLCFSVASNPQRFEEGQNVLVPGAGILSPSLFVLKQEEGWFHPDFTSARGRLIVSTEVKMDSSFSGDYESNPVPICGKSHM